MFIIIDMEIIVGSRLYILNYRDLVYFRFIDLIAME